ncbi:MAG: hypothetical protein M3010_01225, partial [Candidatus Dormibacteraeota bacterium]|nr:hypothetical protein [Candidatus Dormibacteraeota bacterium]
MKARLQEFLTQPELVDDGVLRLVAALMLSAGGVFFFRQRAVPLLVACVVGGGVVLAVLWVGFHRLGARPLGPYWPGLYAGIAAALLVFCLMPPGIPWALAALLAALAVGVEAVERRATVPLAFSGVIAAWLLATLWQARSGGVYIAPFDFHVLDEPITLWVKFQATIDPVRTYAGQAAGPIGATSFGLAALGTLLLSYSKNIAWPTVLAFYVPITALCVAGRLPFNVYLFDAPALVFAAIIGAEARRLPRSLPWRVVTGFLAGAVAAGLLLMGTGYQAFGVGVMVSTAVVTLFQFFGLAGAPGVVDRPAVGADGEPEPKTGPPLTARPTSP